MSEFFAMGGYAAFVWPAWGFGVIILIAITVHSFSGHRTARQKADMLERATSPQKADTNG